MSENKNYKTVSEYEPDKKSAVKNRKSNFIARICSVLLAIILWFYVIRVDSPTHEKSFDFVPIQLSGVQEMLTESGFSVISGYDGMVSVTLSGKQSDLTRLKTEDISATVDLSGVTMSGEHHLPVNVSTQSGIKVLGYEPTTLEVYVDSTLQKDVEVVPRITYSKEESIVLGEYTAEPAIVKVSGPASVVKNIHHVLAEADMGKITKSMSGTGSIKLCNEAGDIITNPYIKTNVSSVDVSVPVYKQKYLTPVVRFSDDIIPAEYINVSFSTPILTVQGDAEYIDALSDEIVVATIDPKQIGEMTTFEVLLESIDDRLDYLEGDTINIDVSLDSSVRNIKRTIPIPLEEANLVVTGVSGTASYSVKSPSVLYITARSVNAMALDAVTVDDITLRVDLSTVSVSGDYKREVVVEFDDEKIFTSDKYTVTFGIEINK